MGHITAAERSEIAILHARGYSDRAIGGVLGRDHTTIGRERKRNGTRRGYDPRVAKTRARLRRRYSKYQGMKVRERPKLQAFITEKLQAYWTPEEVAGYLRYRQTVLPYVSAKGIYKWLYSAHGQAYCPLLPKRRFSPKKRRTTTVARTMIPQRVGIEERPKEANERLELGHAEGDTMLSGKRQGSTAALAVVEDRTSRVTRIRKIPNLQPSTMTSALKKMGKSLHLKTLTLDNGIENRDHESVAASLKIRTFFCNPYHSWEKGSVENTIGRIRRFIPKGANIADYTDGDIAAIEHWLNHTPRKCLNYLTPHDIMTKNLLSPSSHPSGAFEG